MRLPERIAPAVRRIDFVLELELVVLADFAKGIVLVQVFMVAAAWRLVIS